MTRHELIARLEAATGPDVSLDIAIHSFINAGKRIRTDMHGFPRPRLHEAQVLVSRGGLGFGTTVLETQFYDDSCADSSFLHLQ
jgi:hypothetical protein